MTIWKHYHIAHSPEDALNALAEAPGSSRLIAGGTDLLLELQQGLHPPVDTLVDISGVPEMNILELRQEQLFIGAAVPLNQIISSPHVFQHARALYDAASLIGGPQVRNVGSLGGNVAHALPAADGTISLLALGADATIADRVGLRQMPVESLFLGPGKSALNPREELIVGFSIPITGKRVGSAFRRVMRPQGVAIAILNMGVWVLRRQDIVEDIRLAVGPAGPKPFRARTTEDMLRGHPLDPERVQLAVEALHSEVKFRTSPHRATAEYRHHIADSLLYDTLNAAWQRAGE